MKNKKYFVYSKGSTQIFRAFYTKKELMEWKKANDEWVATNGPSSQLKFAFEFDIRNSKGDLII